MTVDGRDRPAGPPSGRPRRLKSAVLVTALLLSALVIVSWTQQWFEVTLVPDALDALTIGVDGDVAAGGLAGLGLAGLALAGALSIAGPVFRVVLGVLEVLIGAVLTLSAVTAVAAPVASSAAAITEATGIAGTDSVAELVQGTSTGFWPYAAVVLGVASMVLGVVIVVTGRNWPTSSRKYQPVRFETEEGFPVGEPSASDPHADSVADPVADWDSLSDGSDPTSR